MIPLIRRSGAGLILAMALGLGLAPSPAEAQQNPNDFSAPPVEETSQGSPYYGYIGIGVILAMSIFAICKSARR
ncbi:hypothetical protein BH23PLA1_BH23PLA1_17620 [soil metagenome]